MENVHLLRYPHPSSLRRTFMYASFLGISEALHMDIFHQPLRASIEEWRTGVTEYRILILHDSIIP
jgi:hypothetical protein